MSSGEPSCALLVSMLKAAAKLRHCLLTSYIYTALGHLDSEGLAVEEHRSTEAHDAGSENGLEIVERVKPLQLRSASLACQARSHGLGNLAPGAPVVVVDEGLLVRGRA